MKHRDLMPHTNMALAVVTFTPNPDEAHIMDATVHHVIGWAVNAHSAPLPITTNATVDSFTKQKWYTFYMPEAVVIDFPNAGNTMQIDEAIQYLQQNMLLQEKPEAVEDDKRKKYNH